MNARYVVGKHWAFLKLGSDPILGRGSHTKLDGNYGVWPANTPPPFKYYPSGAIADSNRSGVTGTLYSKQDIDNITSFSEGTLESRQ